MMYHQILVRPDDCCYQHIVYRSASDLPIQEFELLNNEIYVFYFPVLSKSSIFSDLLFFVVTVVYCPILNDSAFSECTTVNLIQISEFHTISNTYD